MSIPIFIASAVRTPIGRIRGALADARPDDLAALAIKEAVEQSGAPAAAIDEIIYGNANGAGEENRNVARMAGILAGLPLSVPGITVNRLCASGMSAITMAQHMIAANAAEVVVAGGVESMTRAPWVLGKSSLPWGGPGEVKDTSIGWRFTNPQFESGELSRDGKMTYSMPQTAEAVAEFYRVSREDCDVFAYNSHQRALQAIEAGYFNEETVPVEIQGRQGKTSVVDTDDGPREDTSIEVLSGLRAVVPGGSVVTAGNASSLNDGASALVIASENAINQYGMRPLARIVGGTSVGLEPEIMGMGPVPATRKLMRKHNLSIEDFKTVELNEAFASQSLACIRELGLKPEIVNPTGGAIALGHPLGASGARIVATLVHRMKRENYQAGEVGLATMCVGVGQGAALAVEAV